MPAAGVHFASFVQGSPGWFKSYIEFLSCTQCTDTGHRVEGLSVVHYVPFQVKIHFLPLQFMQVATQSGLIGINIIKGMFVCSPSCLEIIACQTRVCINFTIVFINSGPINYTGVQTFSINWAVLTLFAVAHFLVFFGWLE